MQAGLALIPSAVVLIAVLALRWSGLAAAAAAVVATIAIWLAQPFTEATFGQFGRALADAAVLTVLVAATTVPGLIFVEAARRRDAPAAISTLISTIGLSPARAAILIAVGVGVMLESLTGMGVSMLVTVPLLLRVAGRRQAIALALIGMSLMTWGALSISVHLGAKLAALPLSALGDGMAVLSGSVAFWLPLLCLVVLGARNIGDIALAVLAGVTLWLAIWASSRWIGVEVAGVAGGFAVILLMVATASSRTGLGAALSASGVRPYLWLVAAVVAQKLVFAAANRAGFSPTLSTGRVDFALLTSPGLALMAATLLSARGSFDGALVKQVAQRVWRPVLSIALFMLAARLLVECGAIAALAGLLQGLGGAGAVVAVALLGAVSGFATGSAVTGNALFMPSAAAVGESLGAKPLFAALQAGGAGHVSMAALPIIAILLAALPDRTRSDDATALRIGLVLAAWHLVVLIAAGLLLLRP